MMSQLANRTGPPIFSSLADDPDLVEVVQMYIDEMPDRINSLLQAFEDTDLDLLGTLAHQLKGAAGSYGYHEVTPFAFQLEQACRNNASSDDITASLSDLVNMLNRLEVGPGA